MEPWIFSVPASWFYNEQRSMQSTILPWDSTEHTTEATYVVNTFTELVAYLQNIKKDVCK